ncbi:MAG: penicillin-binding protein [Bacteroidota bacterium]
MDVKNEILYRVYGLVFVFFVPIAMVLLYKTVYISWWEGEEWRSEGDELYIDWRTVEAERGNIMAEDGSLLATSVPYYDLYLDPNSTGMLEEDFMYNLDTLAQCLATQVMMDKTVGGVREDLLTWRTEGKRYVPIKRKASYAEKQMIEGFPLFNLGQMRGGLIIERKSERKKPFGILAHRSVGYVREGSKPVGLEGFFHETLGGEDERVLMLNVGDGIWVPMEDLSEVEPKSGDDIRTTLDVNLQDIVENALYKGINYHDADWGTAILMEVETGEVKAIANLGKTSDGEGWWETYNFAVGEGIEPGSTFKLASIMALLEDGYVNLTDSVDIEKGQTEFYEETMEDSSPYSFKLDSTSVKRVFEISSNVGMAKLVNGAYSTKNRKNSNEGAARFIKRLKDFNLHLPTGIEISGEPNPYIKEAYSKEDNWSGVTLPWMAIGYELKLTPLQILTFFNAVANDGEMVKPYLVKEISRFGETIDQFRPVVLQRKIASSTTIEQAKELLEAVVTDGTAYKLQSDRISFAGKTGTAQVDYKRGRRGTRIGGYQASFAGYFPAENPKYSCIVVINKPRQNGFYGGDVAGPVFKEIAEKCYLTKLNLHEELNAKPKPVLASRQLPRNDIGRTEDMKTVLEYLGMPYYGTPASNMTRLTTEGDSLILEQRRILPNRVPSVVGMGLRDALHILENKGLKVKIDGFGKVARQSILPGTKINNQTILLTLR